MRTVMKQIMKRWNKAVLGCQVEERDGWGNITVCHQSESLFYLFFLFKWVFKLKGMKCTELKRADQQASSRWAGDDEATRVSVANSAQSDTRVCWTCNLPIGILAHHATAHTSNNNEGQKKKNFSVKSCEHISLKECGALKSKICQLAVEEH